MGRIPLVQSGVSARSLRTDARGPNTVADGDAFGAGVGRAIQGLAAVGMQAGEAIGAYAERKANETAANKVAQFDFTPDELAIRNKVGPDGAGYREQTLTAFDNRVEEEANKIQDDAARKKFREDMQRQRNSVSSRSATYEFTVSAENSKNETNTALSTLENKILTDPTMYAEYIEQGKAVIDSSTSIPATLRESIKTQWTQNSARSRFTGMLEKATTVEEVDAIAGELAAAPTGSGRQKDDFAGTDWTKEFNPEDYSRMVNTIGTVRKAIVTKADADARAAIDTIEARAADMNVLLPKEELAAVQSLVKQSQNPVTVARMARIVRDQNLYEENRKLPPEEIQAQINATDQNPGSAYPGVPPRVSTAINRAADMFGVSASYLGATAVREYGQFFKRERPKVDAKFAPTPIHKGVDLRNMRPEVVDGLAVAGELFGEAIPVTSGYRSQTKQDGIRAKGDPNRVTVAKHSHHTAGDAADISTVGMSAERKAKLVAALADAGFTGFGEYDTHIHADMREAVPGSFGQNGSTWGGWTNLSPEVMATLQERGFKAGAKRTDVKRNAPVQMSDDVDYTQGTQMTKDDGRPASSAVGVMQFTDGTFLETMKAPGVAQAIGVDIANMSDADLLELRKDPDISIMAGAALAASNKKTLEGALGRSVNDAELYMAHFMGAGGASAFLRGYEKQPEQSAAKLLPDAAKANRNVFYDKNGRERTVLEVYGEISRSLVASPSNVAFGDNQTRKKIVENKTRMLKEDPVQEAMNSGSHAVSPLDQGFAQRGMQARQIADYYNIPVAEMKPFTQQEQASIAKDLESGSADKILQMMTEIQSMGGDVARGALKQIDQTNSVYAYAGGLQLETGNGAVAGDIIRGEKRLRENESIKGQIGAEPSDINAAFNKVTGASLYEVSPRERQSIQDAALAHYVETHVARGGKGFDEDAFSQSVQAVMGGRDGAPAIDFVNGEPTLLPPGVSGEELDTAFERMTVEDWALMSDQRVPPRYVDGTVIDPADLADEAKLRSIGGGKYKVQLDDGTFAVTGNTLGNGRLEAFVFAPTAKHVKNVVQRPYSGAGAAVEPAQGDTSVDALGTPFNVLGQFDENGRWIGPPK